MTNHSYARIELLKKHANDPDIAMAIALTRDEQCHVEVDHPEGIYRISRLDVGIGLFAYLENRLESKAYPFDTFADASPADEPQIRVFRPGDATARVFDADHNGNLRVRHAAIEEALAKSQSAGDQTPGAVRQRIWDLLTHDPRADDLLICHA